MNYNSKVRVFIYLLIIYIIFGFYALSNSKLYETNTELHKTIQEYAQVVNQTDLIISELREKEKNREEEVDWLNNIIKSLRNKTDVSATSKKKSSSNNTIVKAVSSNSSDTGETYIGEFVVTAYCGCKACNGKWYGSPAKNGEQMKEGLTIAVDPSVIPLNSYVYIEGYGRRKAQDTGSAIKGKKIDLYFTSHDKTKQFGKRVLKVYR